MNRVHKRILISKIFNEQAVCKRGTKKEKVLVIVYHMAISEARNEVFTIQRTDAKESENRFLELLYETVHGPHNRHAISLRDLKIYPLPTKLKKLSREGVIFNQSGRQTQKVFF